MAAAIGPAIGLVGSIFGRKSSSKSQTSTTTSQNLPYFTPEQAAMNAMLGRVLRNLGKKPRVDEQLRIQGRNEINDVYDQMNNRLDTTLVARGFGGSGKHNLNTLGLEVNRGQAMGKLEGDLYRQALDRQMQALGLATSFGRAQGSTGTSTTTGTGGGTSWPGAIMGGLGDALPGIGNDIATSLWLRKIMGQNGGGNYGYPTDGMS